MDKQVDKNKYSFNRYCDMDRWSSYWHQVNEVLLCRPEKVLEIGVGDKVFSGYIKNNTGIEYKSLDIAEDLEPDILGSVENIPQEDGQYDAVCAFEVLEHLPFEKFGLCLLEIGRVSNKYAIISLPHWGRHFSFKIRLPYFKTIKWQFKFSIFPPKHKFNGEHYWEIGKKGYPLDKIIKEIKNSGLEIIKDYIAFESPYHHFFVLKKSGEE